MAQEHNKNLDATKQRFQQHKQVPERKKQSLDPSNIDNPTISSAAAYEWIISKKTSSPSPVQSKATLAKYSVLHNKGEKKVFLSLLYILSV